MQEWTRAWLGLLDDSDPQVARRLYQGRAFERSGRVTSLRVEAGAASARVQGSKATPYLVEVDVAVLHDDAWAAVVDALAGQVRHTARLLSGQAPVGLDEELRPVGVSVAPGRDDLDTTCACGDRVWPCAHVAALWQVLASALEDDPFLLPRLRGRGRERLLAELALARRRRSRADRSPGVDPASLDAAHWLSARVELDEMALSPPIEPRTPAGALRLLGDPPGWQGGVSAWAVFSPLVARAAQWAKDLDEDR